MNAYLVRVAASELRGAPVSADDVRRIIDRADGTPSSRLGLGEGWAVLHFLLTAEVPMPKPEALRRGVSWSDESLENVLMGGVETPYSGSFGAARYLDPKEVSHIALSLRGVDVDEAVSQYDPDVLMEEGIPLGEWGEESEAREWLRRGLAELIEFYTAAASSREGILIYMV